MITYYNNDSIDSYADDDATQDDYNENDDESTLIPNGGGIDNNKLFRKYK